MIVLTIDQPFEALDGISKLNEDTGQAGEHLGHVHWLRQEPLDLAGTRDGELVLLRQLVHAENGDNVLKRLVALQHLLDLAGDVVVLLANDKRREHARG